MSKNELLFPELASGQLVEKELERLNAIRSLSVKEGQLIIDQLFSAKKREQKLSEQEEDARGLKVRYFRKMSLEAFIKMVKTGYQDAASYAKGELPVVSQDELKYFIINSFPFDKQEAIEEKNLGLKDLIDEHFGKRIYERLEEAGFSYASVMDFTANYLDESYLKQRHTGSTMQKLSPFLSMSVGGVISTLSSEKYPYQAVYCEIVKHDIITHKDGVNGEKEVFTKKLNIEDVIGAYVDDDKIFELIRNDDTFSQGNFYKEHKNEMRYADDVIEEWRWEVNTNDCLPKRLQS